METMKSEPVVKLGNEYMSLSEALAASKHAFPNDTILFINLDKKENGHPTQQIVSFYRHRTKTHTRHSRKVESKNVRVLLLERGTIHTYGFEEVMETSYT